LPDNPALLLEQLREWGIDIFSGQINRLLLEDKALFHAEKDTILEAGLTVSSYVTVDDSGADRLPPKCFGFRLYETTVITPAVI